MHVRVKAMATAGLLVAFSVIMLVLSSVIETNSLFLIAAASFCVGIAIREWGLWIGFAFLAASILLNMLLVPNKLYCLTFAAMGLYLWLYEWLWKWIAEKTTIAYRTARLWIGKFVFFNVLYVPILFFMPKLIFTGKINGLAVILFLLAGQVVFFIYDAAYRYFQSRIWGKFRGRLIGN